MKIIIKFFNWLRSFFISKTDPQSASSSERTNMNRSQKREQARNMDYFGDTNKKRNPNNNRKRTRGRNYEFKINDYEVLKSYPNYKPVKFIKTWL